MVRKGSSVRVRWRALAGLPRRPAPARNPGWTAGTSSRGFSVGDRVTREDDGKVGTVATLGAGDGLGVRWEPGGVVQMVVPGLLKRI